MSGANILDDLIEHATAVKAREASSFSGSNYERSAYRLAERVLELVTEGKSLVAFCEESGSEIVLSAATNFVPVRRPRGGEARKEGSTPSRRQARSTTPRRKRK